MDNAGEGTIPVQETYTVLYVRKEHLTLAMQPVGAQPAVSQSNRVC